MFIQNSSSMAVPPSFLEDILQSLIKKYQRKLLSFRVLKGFICLSLAVFCVNFFLLLHRKSVLESTQCNFLRRRGVGWPCQDSTKHSQDDETSGRAKSLISLTNLPIVVMLKSRDKTAIKQALTSLHKRTKDYQPSIYISTLYYEDPSIYDVLNQFPFTVIKPSLRKSESKCFKEIKKKKINFLNRNASHFSTESFSPRLLDRNDDHNFFSVHHNHPQNPLNQMYFKNSISEYLEKTSNLTTASYMKYLLQEEYLSPVNLQYYPTGDEKWMEVNSRNDKSISKIRFSNCQVLENFKESLLFIFSENTNADKLVIVSDEYIFSSDFASFIWQSQDVISMDPSIFCISLGNPLHPSILPKPSEFHSANPHSEQFQNKLQKERKRKHTDFEFLSSGQVMRRVDHFLYHGSVIVTKEIVEEIQGGFTLTPYPATRSSPRPVDFLEPGSNYPEIKEYETDHIDSQFDNENWKKTIKAEKFDESKMFDNIQYDFDIMVELSEWLTWNSRLRGCLHPAIPRTCKIEDIRDYKTLVKNIPSLNDEDVDLPSLRRVKNQNKNVNNRLTSRGAFLSWETLKKMESKELNGVKEDVRVDFENCLSVENSEVNLANLNRMVRHRYEKQIFFDMHRSEIVPVANDSSCLSVWFPPKNYTAGATYVLFMKMTSTSDDYTLLRLLECFGISKSSRGFSRGIQGGNFNGVYQLQVGDGSVVYAMAIPSARLSPEMASSTVVSARPGTSFGIIILPNSEFEDSRYVWRKVPVFAADDYFNGTLAEGNTTVKTR